jgi:hypothetical protein
MSNKGKDKPAGNDPAETGLDCVLYRRGTRINLAEQLPFFVPTEVQCHISKTNIFTQHPLLSLVLSSLLMALPVPSLAQENSFPSPSTTCAVGNKDSGAIAQIKQHLQAVSSAEWQDLKGTGTLTYPSGDIHKASLYLMGSNNSRLDIVMDSGTRSLRVTGTVGKFQDENNNQGSLPPATSSTGIVAFPQIWSNSTTSPLLSLCDRESYSGTGQSLHRITVEHPVDNKNGSLPGKKTVATDLYFDPTTHLLLYSVESVVFNRVRKPLMRVTSYSAYQSFNGVLVPTVIRQALNGQEQWTLKLSQVELNTHLSADTFLF